MTSHVCKIVAIGVSLIIYLLHENDIEFDSQGKKYGSIGDTHTTSYLCVIVTIDNLALFLSYSNHG
jgi:hypothetical protein